VLDRARLARVESIGVLVCAALALLATPALEHTVAYYGSVLHGEAPAQGYGLWGHLSPVEPLDLLFVAVALPLLALALQSRPAPWESALLLVLAGMSVDARRNGIWLLLFAAPHAARALGLRLTAVGAIPPRLGAVCLVVPVAVAVAALRQPPPADTAGGPLLERAVNAAHGTPILADALDAEKLALGGARIWIGNPLDAFPRSEQRRYLDWLQGKPAGDSLLRRARVVVVLRGTTAQRRVSRNSAFRELARDERAVVYLATA
jgi:hypothetical protein